LDIELPEMLYERVIEVDERVAADGKVLEPLDLDGVRDDLRRCRDDGYASIAIAFVHGYRYGDHEARVAALARDLGFEQISASHEVSPLMKLVSRGDTTVVDAYLSPILRRYVDQVDAQLRPVDSGLRLAFMQSNGGLADAHRFRGKDALLSGPAGGVVGMVRTASAAGFDRLIGFDMGGTSTDVSLCPGRPLSTREFEIDGQPVAIPVLDIHTVGAGGGSLARVDAGGALRVGPQSAGAEPGPISYGRGGAGVTVTDAHVWLGRLPVDAFLGGEGRLDRERIREPLETIARKLDVSAEEAADGILAVADTAMERALRVISVERGYDPADFAVVAFGGAGALHVAELTRRLGAARALVPPDPGLLSAYGMLASPVTREASRTVLASTSDPGLEPLLREVFATLEERAVREMLDEGAEASTLVVERWIDARYRGQSYELRVSANDWIRRFHASHLERYGYERPDTPVEAVTLRLVVTAPSVALEHPGLPEADGPPPTSSTDVVHAGATVPTRRVWRRDLRAGHRLAGPLIVQEYSATTWVPPGWRVTV
ncbi:MAG TPA: hydantoinase/oxoprolinase family protein, partial [Longimicrobiales bacterium]|nr:hydantoinase/oxoprolinase family protein [Longimicrobiales bacterium]